jgi:hypothetical protein
MKEVLALINFFEHVSIPASELEGWRVEDGGNFTNMIKLAYTQERGDNAGCQLCRGAY